MLSKASRTRQALDFAASLLSYAGRVFASLVHFCGQTQSFALDTGTVLFFGAGATTSTNLDGSPLSAQRVFALKRDSVGRVGPCETGFTL